MTFLREMVKPNLRYTKGQRLMFDLRGIRLVENIDGYSTSLVKFSFITETLEATEHKLHLERCEEWKEWDIE